MVEEEDVSIELSTENDDELQLTDDIQLELEQLLSISQVVVVINNENIDEHCQEEVTSDSTNNEEDYDPAELASGYLRRCIRSWAKQWIQNRTLPESKRGKHPKMKSLWNHEDVAAQIRSYARSNKE
ncbi:17258_t:CDS:2 [Entrophospora sp. SA101]|nr:17258_t:CDS:2 [Entrophospora sp. SA101]